MQDIVNLIQNVGFPIAMVLWFLTVGGKKLDGITGSIDKLTAAIEKMVENNAADHREFRTYVSKCPGPPDAGDPNDK